MNKKIEIGDYYIETDGESLKITNINNKHGISVLPSSANSVVIKPIPIGSAHLKQNE